MRAISYTFDSLKALAQLLDAEDEEQALPLPSGERGRDSEWVLATFQVGTETTSVASCVVDRGAGLKLLFEDRDWKRLRHFIGVDEVSRISRPSMPPSVAPSGVRLLVVDDDRDTQEVLSQLLVQAGYRVLVCASAEEAFDRLRDTTIDLILLDRDLPGMNGIDFCCRVRREPRFGAVPIMFVTAHSGNAGILTAFEAGADDFVAKPFRAPEIVARVQVLLHRAQVTAL